VLDAVPGGRSRSENHVRARVSDTLVLIPCEDFSYASGRVETLGCSWAPTCPSTLKQAAGSYTHVRCTCLNFDKAAGLNDFRAKISKSVFQEETRKSPLARAYLY